MSEHDQPQDDANEASEFWIDASVPDDEEVPDVLVGVTARESDALEHLHLLLGGSAATSWPTPSGSPCCASASARPRPCRRRRSNRGSRPRRHPIPLEDLRPGRWEEDWERW